MGISSAQLESLQTRGQMLSAMRIVAFDPSITATGWAVMNYAGRKIEKLDSGEWHPSTAKSARDRYDQLADFARKIIEPITDDTFIVIELPSGGQRHSAKQLMSYARAIGVIEGVANQCCPDRSIRVQVNGWKGNKPKEATMREVEWITKRKPRTHNEADAIGLALWFIGQRGN